jgi:hypothetical protein
MGWGHCLAEAEKRGIRTQWRKMKQTGIVVSSANAIGSAGTVLLRRWKAHGLKLEAEAVGKMSGQELVEALTPSNWLGSSSTSHYQTSPQDPQIPLGCLLLVHGSSVRG